VVDFNLAFFQFISECNSENIIKIGPYLPKLLQEKFGAVFFGPPCISPTESWTILTSHKHLDRHRKIHLLLNFSQKVHPNPFIADMSPIGGDKRMSLNRRFSVQLVGNLIRGKFPQEISGPQSG